MDHDTSVIRPEMRWEHVRVRGEKLTAEQKAATRKALQTLHSLECMAINIYKCEITPRRSALNTALCAAMCNEMTHLQDFQTKLYEHGLKPSKLRWRFWLAGYVLGLGSRFLGPQRVLKTGVWAETKAVHHYGRLLNAVKWDEDVRAVIEKDRADEQAHIDRWKQFLDKPQTIR